MFKKAIAGSFIAWCSSHEADLLSCLYNLLTQIQNLQYVRRKVLGFNCSLPHETGVKMTGMKLHFVLSTRNLFVHLTTSLIELMQIS